MGGEELCAVSFSLLLAKPMALAQTSLHQNMGSRGLGATGPSLGIAKFTKTYRKMSVFLRKAVSQFSNNEENNSFRFLRILGQVRFPEHFTTDNFKVQRAGNTHLKQVFPLGTMMEFS